MKNSYILPACFFLFVSGAFAQTVGPDPGFGNNGMKFTGLNRVSGAGSENDLLLQPDGKLILGGAFPSGTFSLVRYHPNGSLDPSFQSDQFSTGHNYALGFQGSDKILLYFGSRLYRYNIDGEIDTSFGEDGAIANLPNTSIGYAVGLNQQADGKILVWGDGYDGDATSFDLYMKRVTPDGQLDSTFAENGLFWFDYNGDIDIPFSAAVQSDGKILLGGTTYIPNTFGWHVLMARLHPDGTMDSTFGVNGVIEKEFKGSDKVYGIAVQPDNKILICGYTSENDIPESIVARFNPEGNLDSTFGDFGVRYFPDLDGGYDIAVRPGNKIVFCSSKGNLGGSWRFVVTQLLENGENDPSFGNDGFYTFPYSPLHPTSFVFPDTNKIVIYCAEYSSQVTFKGVLVGLLTDLILDTKSLGNLEQPAIWAYPNPVSDVVHLRFQLEQREILNISLSDANGKTLATFYSESDFEAGEHELILNIPPGTPPGTYFLQVNGKGKATTIQLIKH